MYALKILKKNEILRRNQLEHTLDERRILVSHCYSTFCFRLSYLTSFNGLGKITLSSERRHSVSLRISEQFQLRYFCCVLQCNCCTLWSTIIPLIDSDSLAFLLLLGKRQSRVYCEDGLRIPNRKQALLLPWVLPRWWTLFLLESNWKVQVGCSKVLRC